MMCPKCSVILSVLVIFFTVSTYAAVFTQPAAKHPAYPGRCYDKITRKTMLPGKEYHPKGICAAMTCDLERSMINIETCPFIEMPGCEELPVDPSWSYPKCCPQFVCKDFKTGKEIFIDVFSS